MPYAEGTTVPVEKSQMEIAAVVRKYGAASFATGWSGNRAVVSFVSHQRQVRFLLDLPDPADWRKYIVTKSGGRRTEKGARDALESESKRRWRALLLAIKAKFEVVETGISTFEAEFMPHTVMPDGRTVAEHMLPRIQEAIESGRMPNTLLEIEGK